MLFRERERRGEGKDMHPEGKTKVGATSRMSRSAWRYGLVVVL